METKKENMNQEKESAKLPKEIIEKLFPNELPTPEELEKKYPPRDLPKDAMVTRFGPSPTGFVHIGGLYAEILAKWFARQTKGVSFLRIEDTDELREIPGAKELIVKALDIFDISPDEGPSVSGEEKGKYGPYTQSERPTIYQAFAKKLVEEGKAYPCFMTNEELEKQRGKQTEEKIRPGYRGEWAKWRDALPEKIEEELSKGTPFVIRLRANGVHEKRIVVVDEIKGTMELPENDIDDVILKSNGLPPYGFAHVVDDHLMGTTHVTRGVDWLPQTPFHLELFSALGFKPPKYAHFGNILKEDGKNEKGDIKLRKISKRLDPEANAMKYIEWGYPTDAVIQYLLNMMNSDFEDKEWRKNNPDAPLSEFEISFKKLEPHAKGSLFDFVKLNDISKDIISRMTAEEIYGKGLVWAKEYDAKLAEEMEKNPEYTKSILNIERLGEARGRKDIGKWADLNPEIGYFFDDIFDEIKLDVEMKDRDIAVQKFLETYNENDTKDEWFAKVKDIARDLGYAEGAKQFKQEPEKYKGQVGDIAKIFRVLLTGKTNTPDLHSIMKVMGKERVTRRLNM
jgi:glutamyl-tRNA synthetase